MNKRQAKKQYKKIHGHNPPKTAVTKYTPEEMEAMKVYNLTPEDIERIGNGLRDAFAEMFKTLQRVAESMARVFEDMGKKYSRPVIETEEPPVVVARIYELDRATDTIMVKETLEEIEMDIKEHTAMTFIPRGTADVPSLVGVWM
jgi:hypothetical protein